MCPSGSAAIFVVLWRRHSLCPPSGGRAEGGNNPEISSFNLYQKYTERSLKYRNIQVRVKLSDWVLHFTRGKTAINGSVNKGRQDTHINTT